MKTKTGKTLAPNASQRNWSSTGAPLLTTPQNGPGFTPAKPTRGMPKAAERVTSTAMAATYDGAELRPVAGLTPDRLEAFRLPSRMGNQLHYPDGRVEMVGAA